MGSGDAPPPASYTPHIWLENTLSVTQTEGRRVTQFPGNLERNIHAFADRTGHALIYTATITEAASDRLAERLRVADENGVEVWLSLWGDPDGPADRELVEQEDAMEQFLADVRAVTEVYADHYPEGRMLIWHEFFGNWTGDSTAELADSMLEYGPTLFARQQAVIRDVAPGIDVGVFPRHTIQAPPEYTGKSIFEPLMSRLAERDALPDFSYVCSYRGYEDWDAGYEATNDYHRAVFEHNREAMGGRPVYYINQAHTINNGYTPSKMATVGSARNALAADVESLGLLNRPDHVATHRRCYNPFLPTTGDVDDSLFTSFTGWRDRMTWAALGHAERADGFDPEETFDLWVYGRNFAFEGTALSARTVEGDWAFVGDFSGYVPGDYPHAPTADSRAVAFHALDRDRFLDQDSLRVRLEGAQDDPATVTELHAVPHLGPADYRSELTITDIVERESLAPYRLGGWDGRLEVADGDTHEVSLGLSTDAPRDIRELVHPVQRDVLDRLERREATPGFDATELFDLWVYGEGILDADVALGETTIDDAGDAQVVDQFDQVDQQYVPIDEYSDPQPPAAFDADGEALVFRGLDRAEFSMPEDPRHANGARLEIRVASTDTSVLHGVYAMPYHGSAAFLTDPEVADAIERDFERGEGQLNTFALGHQLWPGGAHLRDGETVESWVQLFDRTANVVQNV